MAADWSILPWDPLGAIALKLDTFEDFIHFSGVCRWWNCAWSLVKHQWKAELPSLLLAENNKKNPDCLRKIFNLNNNQFYELNLPETFGTRCWGSAYGWVAMADSKRNVQLFNPITKAQIHFPSFKSLEHYENDYEVISSYFRYYLLKLIVVKVSRNNRHEFVIMVIYDVCKNYLAFAREGDQSWTSVSIKELEMDPTRRYITQVFDVVARNDQIFALYGNGEIVHWNAREFYSREFLEPLDYSPPGSIEMFSAYPNGRITIYLVDVHGDLMMVVRYKEHIFDTDNPEPGALDREIVYRTNAFDVFKLNGHNRWEKIQDLGNVVLFVGCNYSMSISLGVAQSLQHSCVYFTDDEFDYWRTVKDFGGHDMGCYDMKRSEVLFYKCDDKHSLFYKCDDTRSLFCPPIWFIPRL